MIYITGAGCGDFSLMTLKARHVIEQADCILYDRLLDPQILSYAPQDCEIIYVGKRNHHHSVPQNEINRLLVEKGRQYECVVRLKGGDPYVFGRGSEEALYIHHHGLPFEVIPGVTSAVAGCGAAGIPVTHRGIAYGVRIMSAHNKEDEMSDLDFESMAKTEDTLVFLMGLSNLDDIVARLLQAGKNPETQIALISNGAKSSQQYVSATLSTIREMDHQHIVSPALIVVGDVVKFHKELYNDHRLLQGKTYMMAAMQQEEEMLWQFTGEGASLEVIRCGHVVEHEGALAEIELADITHILFTSRNAVEAFFHQLLAGGSDARALAHCRLCAIGMRTAAVLERFACHCDMVSPVADSTHLASYMLEHLHEHDHVLCVKADNHNDTLMNMLKSRCRCETLAIYHMEYEEQDLEEHEVDGILFTCSSSVHAMMKMIREWKNIMHVPMYAIGKPTQTALKEYGCTHIICLKEADKKQFIDAVIKEECNICIVEED